MTIETEDVVALCQRLRLRFRHSAYLATDARLSTDPDCQEAADLIQSLSDRIDVLEGICAEMLVFADSGAAFSYPLGSLQKLREVCRG
jgi:hypothetical protein